MTLSYRSAQDELIIISMRNRERPLLSLNFPAVTICNLNQVYKPSTVTLSKKL